MSYLPWVAPIPQDLEAVEEASVESIAEYEQQLYDIALRALGRKDYSRKELERYLVQRSRALDEAVDWDPIIAEILGRLETQGWLDEARAIEALLMRSQYRQLGAAAKRQKLQQLGYTEAAIEHALAETDPEEEYLRLHELATKRSVQLAGLDDETRERRLVSYLMRRGYASSQVFAVVRDVLRSSHS